MIIMYAWHVPEYVRDTETEHYSFAEEKVTLMPVRQNNGKCVPI